MDNYSRTSDSSRRKTSLAYLAVIAMAIGLIDQCDRVNEWERRHGIVADALEHSEEAYDRNLSGEGVCLTDDLIKCRLAASWYEESFLLHRQETRRYLESIGEYNR